MELPAVVQDYLVQCGYVGPQVISAISPDHAIDKYRKRNGIHAGRITARPVKQEQDTPA